MKHEDHICRFNDGECVCTCYDEGFRRGVLAALEKVPVKWSPMKVLDVDPRCEGWNDCRYEAIKNIKGLLI